MDKNAYLIELSESKRTDFGRIDFFEQPEVQKVFSAIWAIESQINSGGFLQYFTSQDGETANFAPIALRLIGAIQCAVIVENALHLASTKPLPDPTEDRRQLFASLTKEVKANIEELDSQFLAYPDNLTNLLFDYVTAHGDVFGTAE